MFLREAYAIFREEFPEISVGFSTFCKLRPANVLLLHETPEDQCKCLICENAFLKLKSLNIAYDPSTFWESTLCNITENSQCWQGMCDVCSLGQKIMTSEEAGKVTTWKEWGKNDAAQFKCTLKEACIAELLSIFKEQFSVFARHINVKRIQAAEFQQDKDNPNIRILQLDFAMNYSCAYQNEVQSALWSRASVTLFTAAAMTKSSGCKTFLICSDTKEKEKNTVKTFVSRLYEELEPNSTENIGLTEVLWTDGPSSEFKNRFMVLFLQQLSKKYEKPFKWKYFATSHGKGVVDGIGGRAKSIVRNAVMSKKTGAPIVQSAEDFYNLSKQLIPSTTVFLITETDIERDDSVWQVAEKIPGIKKIHCIEVSGTQFQTKFLQNARSPVPTTATPKKT